MSLPALYYFEAPAVTAKDCRAACFVNRLTRLGYRAGLRTNQSEPGTFAIETAGTGNRVRVHPLPNETRLPEAAPV